MKVRHESLVPLPAAEAFEMNIDPAFQEAKCAARGAKNCEVSTTRSGDTATVITRRTMLPVGFPALLRKFAPSGLTTTETVRWAAADERGGRVARLLVDMGPAPTTMTGTMTLTPDGASSTRIVLDAEFRATVPLLGRRIEQLAAPIIESVIRAEEETAAQLARSRNSAYRQGR